MIEKSYEQLKFVDKPEKKLVEVIFLEHFYFEIDYTELEILGNFKVEKGNFLFERKETKFDHMIDRGFSDLKSRITKKKAIYVHKNSNIPLIGNGSFGIVDRGTNVIEIKPVCGCNIDCVYCSVDENKRGVDFVVEKDYLVNELKKVADIKKHPVEIHIGCQGEPLLYSPLVELIRGCSKIPNVKKVSIDTNVTLLNEKKIDDMIEAGLTQFNSSLNSLDKKRSAEIANSKYNVGHVEKMIKYISTKPVTQVIAPVWVQSLNDEDIEPIIELCKETGAICGIQNYLSYSLGKNAGKSITMESFYDKLKALEKKHDIKLIISLKDDFGIVPDENLPKLFKKGDIIDVEIVSFGRMGNEMIGVADGRSISIYDNKKEVNRKIGKRIPVKIIRSKHNIYAAEAL